MNEIKKMIWPGIFFLAFIVLIILLKVVDVAAIGPEGTVIGLSTINGKISELIGVHYLIYNLSEILGYICFIPIIGFGLLGLMQLVKRKSLAEVDRNILCLGGLYIVTFILYILFDKIAINFRPILMEGETFPEPSFPSSHTMLALVVAVSAVLNMEYYIKNKTVLATINISLLLIGVLVILFRFVSGVHWFTDIVGSILISLSLLTFYSAVMGRPKRRKKKYD